MVNKKNILGWFNLALRLILSFGLIFIISHFLGDKSVAVWIVYITIIATINSVDGLLSQFFIRDIIAATWNTDNEKRICSFYNQQTLYSAISLFVFIIVFKTLKLPLNYLLLISFLFSVYMVSRIIDSRFKAFHDAKRVQTTEIVLNILFLIYVVFSISISTKVEDFIVLHLLGLIGLMLYKVIAVSKSEGYKLYKSKATAFFRMFKLDQDILKTITISFGSGLSINLSLILMEAIIPNGVSTQFLFTYRVAALICEIISIPVIIRIPELTRVINSNNIISARVIFMRNYKHSIIFCVLSMSILFSLRNSWNELFPDNLHLTSASVLFYIFGSWLFERTATLLSQFYLSCKSYYIYKYYVHYIALIIVAVSIAVYTRDEVLFSASTLLINVYLAIHIVRNWRTPHAI